ncbi:MAG: hypothetical protein IKZ47_05575 [Clostridia bacterium]|nr:hypothetical protein [Clostridia bacterium]
MNNLKRVLCLAVSFLLIFAVCACGDDDTAQNNKKDAAVSTNSEKDNTDTNDTGNKDGEEINSNLEIEPRPVIVDEALNYEKDVIATSESIEIGWDPTGFKHKIRLPKITADTENAKKFNKKIYDTFKDVYEVLQNNLEENNIYFYDYIYKIYDGFIGIIVNSSAGVQCGGISPGYTVFYYDIDNDKELTYEEYLTALDLSKEKLHIKISNTKAYQNSDTVIGEIYFSIIDTESTVIICEAPETMDGWLEVTTEPIV